MKKVFIFISLLMFTSCGGSDGGGGSDNSGDADYYIRSGQMMPAVFSLSGPPNGYNPVLDLSLNPPDLYRPSEVIHVNVYANGVQATALSTVNKGHLAASILVVTPSQLAPLSDMFENKCSVPNIKIAMFDFVTRDDDLDIIKVGVNGNTEIWYSYAYSDGNADVNCRYTDSYGDLIDIKLSIKSGWNEIRTSDVNISSITATDEFWIINF